MPITIGMLTSQTPDWYTPPAIVADVITFFGRIDLDPCSYPGNPIPATRHECRDGLGIDWDGQRVYCNPPYGREIGVWVRKALTMRAGECVLLLPARTDTAWFQPLFSYPLCFVRGRLKFSGAANSAPFPSVVAYLGARSRFRETFGHWGATVVPDHYQPDGKDAGV